MPNQPDFHVHTQFSWDASHGDMEATCRRALELGLPAIAFTDHADFAPKSQGNVRPLDVQSYLAEVERCRTLFPHIRILSGVELGEPHWHPEKANAIRAAGLDRVLASVHGTSWRGGLLEGSELWRLRPEEAPEFLRAYLQEAVALVESSEAFEVLAHIDFPKRYWPHALVRFCEEDFEEEYRAVLRGLAARGGVLELNTTRGAEPPERGFCPGPAVLRWWVEEGGRTLSFGADAHQPEMLARGFEVARQLADAVGFKPNEDPTGFWMR